MTGPMWALVLQAAIQAPAAPQAPAAARIPVQLGVRIDPDTVTVGQRFIVLVRVRAPAGATVEFPVAADSLDAPTTAAQVIGAPLIQDTPAAGAAVRTAAYRMTAWDTGLQPLLLGNIVVKANGQTGYVSLGRHRVFVRSVLPVDSARRIPKPPREPVPIEPFSEIPWLLFFAALLLAALLGGLWHAYRRWRDRPLDPYSAAEREFARIEALGLVAAGQGERHVAMMIDAMRVYLAARVAEIEMSHTSSELIAAGGSVRPVMAGLGELLWRGDLVKFAGDRIDPEEAGRFGGSARGIVQSVETELSAREAEARRVATKRAA